MAGLEALALGALVLVAGTLIALNAWAALDARYAAGAAARAAVAAAVSAPGEADGRQRADLAQAAATAAVTAHGHDPAGLEVRLDGPAPPLRCAEVLAEVRLEVGRARLPFSGHGLTARSRAAALVEPYRAGLGAKEAQCG